MKTTPFIALLCLPPALVTIRYVLPAGPDAHSADGGGISAAPRDACAQHAASGETGPDALATSGEFLRFREVQHHVDHSRRAGDWTEAELAELGAVIDILNAGCHELYARQTEVIEEVVSEKLRVGEYELVTNAHPLVRHPASSGGMLVTDQEGTKAVQLFPGDSVELDRLDDEYRDYVAAGEDTIRQLIDSFDRPSSARPEEPTR